MLAGSKCSLSVLETQFNVIQVQNLLAKKAPGTAEKNKDINPVNYSSDYSTNLVSQSNNDERTCSSPTWEYSIFRGTKAFFNDSIKVRAHRHFVSIRHCCLRRGTRSATKSMRSICKTEKAICCASPSFTIISYLTFPPSFTTNMRSTDSFSSERVKACQACCTATFQKVKIFSVFSALKALFGHQTKRFVNKNRMMSLRK